MSTTAKPLTGADMDETIIYGVNDLSGSEPGPGRPMGNSDMPSSDETSPVPGHMPPQAQGRYTFSSGARPLDGYTIKRAIGRGGFGEVYYATSDSGKEVALKLILRNLDVERRGVMQCMNLKCPNLLAIFDLKDNDEGDSFVVMEYVAGPSLANVLKQYPEGLPLPEVRRWLKGLVEGVAYLHDHGIVHRDLKPANLFMEEGIVKIGDYGLAKLITPSHGSEHSESIGTCHYMAPEVGSGKYHKPIDVYAIGVILYEMLTGHVPFDGETVNEVLMKHLTARADVSALPEPYRRIVAKALAKDPNQRPSRVYDLLPAEDAPKAPDVRIIGGGRQGQQGEVLDAAAAARTSPRPEEDVFRIEAEEPVFYIGPETRPPRVRVTVQQRLRANWEALRRPAAYRRPAQAAQARPRTQPQPRAARPAAAPPPRQATAPAPPPEPPTLPSGRVRVAELSGSMLSAAPMAAILALPVALMTGIDLESSPQLAAYLFGMTLVGTWIALIANKLLEGREADGTTRRLAGAFGGLVLGAVAIALNRALELGMPQSRLFSGAQDLEPIYFGALFALTAGWQGAADRGRSRRFRLGPLLWTTILAALLSPAWPYNRPDGVAVAALIAATTQIVSPWSEQAARYARYVRTNRNKNDRNVQVA
ncbi:Serine/threonine-protein kinase StkP [Aquisphaera giovannonii]|uniref:Serine/threonine-protein kinase StkP n=1 Tax=Aquisphaera giovannonii TaxID=406548 RepID=A0A5B9WEL8_9BACT|nr:serine/threonine-protein kinase [Aquisphaera giovannonii]QEH38689.1 Serine/threonine-protein kinase StkP [Aquisphaera giovannonii]